MIILAEFGSKCLFFVVHPSCDIRNWGNSLLAAAPFPLKWPPITSAGNRRSCHHCR